MDELATAKQLAPDSGVTREEALVFSKKISKQYGVWLNTGRYLTRGRCLAVLSLTHEEHMGTHDGGGLRLM